MSKSKEPQPDLPNVIRNPGGYRALSEPFENFAAANEAINDFFKDVRDLRAKHRLADVYIILRGSALGEDGDEGDWIISQHHGSSLNCESMTAWAFGQEATRRQESIAKVVAAGGITRREHQK